MQFTQMQIPLPEKKFSENNGEMRKFLWLQGYLSRCINGKFKNLEYTIVLLTITYNIFVETLLQLHTKNLRRNLQNIERSISGAGLFTHFQNQPFREILTEKEAKFNHFFLINGWF
jgi:hypothetical protein